MTPPIRLLVVEDRPARRQLLGLALALGACSPPLALPGGLTTGSPAPPARTPRAAPYNRSRERARRQRQRSSFMLPAIGLR